MEGKWVHGLPVGVAGCMGAGWGGCMEGEWVRGGWMGAWRVDGAMGCL